MAKPSVQARGRLSEENAAISRISVCGYKSIHKEQSIEVRPLTILAGANSSGKSSMMQLPLLLKQTLEATYDPGALLLNGPNVRLKSASDFLPRTGASRETGQFSVRLGIGSGGLAVALTFGKKAGHNLELLTVTRTKGGHYFLFHPGMSREEIVAASPPIYGAVLLTRPGSKLTIARDRCFLVVLLKQDGSAEAWPAYSLGLDLEPQLRGLIHLPGLRGNPAREYPLSGAHDYFPGTFEAYTASLVSVWQRTQRDKLALLNEDLQILKLTWKVAAKPLNEAEVELQVGRVPHPKRGGAHDLVNIADVGFGVSQVLPVLVALLAAKPGQLVYLEQPEIHLHPAAQFAMAQVLAKAAKRGVRVVLETHSALLLLGVQTLVAEGKLEPDLVKLHWFRRNSDGATEVTSADLDGRGAFGDWPEDFGPTDLQAQDRYLSAVEAREAPRK